MKKGTEEALAKSDVVDLLRNGRAFSYLVLTADGRYICIYITDAYPILRLVAFKLLLVYSLLMSNPPIFRYLVLLIEIMIEELEHHHLIMTGD